MATDPRLPELLARWRELQSHGITPDVHEFCHDYPDLEEQFRRLITTPTNWSGGEETALAPSDLNKADAPVLAPPREPGELGRLGDFRVLRIIGRGGMGIVYEGEDAHLHRRVAIKVLLPGLSDEKFRERFLREARAVASLNDDRIVTVFQAGKQGDTPFMVMEYLEGETLEGRMARQQTIPLAEAARIAREVAEGLAVAHSKQMVHRDIKPGNIWLDKDGGHVKLLDFGLVRPLSGADGLTNHGAIAGTIGYMAPEQIYAGPLDGRTDLYALGCVLFRMLTGALPHEAPDTMAVLDAVVNHEPIKLDAVARNLPAPVADLLRRLLARDPKDRPASAEAVAAELADIEKAVRGQAPATQLAASPHRPRYGVWGIAIAAVMVLAACVVGVVSQYHRLFHRQGEPAAASPTAGPTLDEANPIRIGVLHSQTGPNRDSEGPMINAISMAVDEINKAGGVLGRKVEVVVRDTRSDDDRAPIAADEMIGKENVVAVFGGWSSAARKMVADVCARHDQVLYHSCLGEGLEEHPNVVYVGGAPNQQLRVAATYVMSEMGKKKAFLVGSKFDLYSHAAHEILRADITRRLRGEVVDDVYVDAATDYAALARKIKESGADVIFNTIDGPDNGPFFKALRQAGVSSAEVPTVWLGIGEDEMGVLDLSKAVGDVTVNPYFQSLPSTENKDFVDRYRSRFPSHNRISDATAASYEAVHLWKKAVEKANSTDPLKVREAVRGQEIAGPEGTLRIDEKNLYAWRRPRVGKMGDNQYFEVVFGSEGLVPPKPFPDSRPREEWEAFLMDLYKKWGNRWNGPKADAAPETPK